MQTPNSLISTPIFTNHNSNSHHSSTNCPTPPSNAPLWGLKRKTLAVVRVANSSSSSSNDSGVAGSRQKVLLPKPRANGEAPGPQQHRNNSGVRKFKNFMKQPVNCLACATFHPCRAVSSIHPIRLTAMSGR
ncbi:hypothetical protein Pint_04225 [Pistacia integerrima]|uniref:Uncharacterized protein n=1 Tax=Pistacia integerrima TaxID=434235 RepID=A0ACC0Z916_9ROSI|nr:hypothetical protein Pint_04225 [Pistacia integerrima]